MEQNRADELLDVMARIPEKKYDGAKSCFCLCGYPAYCGELQNDYCLWRSNRGPDQPVSPLYFLADWFGIATEKMIQIFGGASDPEYEHDLPAALTMAARVLGIERTEDAP